MPEENIRQVSVTDVNMPFMSMVRFMVKWAVASIPALLILVLLGMSLAAAITALGRIRNSTPTTNEVSSGVSVAPKSESAAYLSLVAVKNVEVAEGTLGETGVFGEVKNIGNRNLKEVEITIYCLGADGRPIFEKQYHPVLVSEVSFGMGDQDKPLKPGYARKFGVKLDDAPSEWSKKVEVKVTSVVVE